MNVRQWTARILAALLSLHMVSAANAARAKTYTTTVVIDQALFKKGGVVVEERTRKEIELTEGRKVPVESGVGEEMVLRVVDANPVFYTYSVKDVVKTPTDSKQAADKLGSTLEALLTGLKSQVQARSGTSLRIVVEGVDVEQLSSRIVSLRSQWEGLPKLIDKLRTPAGVEEAKEEAKGIGSQINAFDLEKDLDAATGLWIKLIGTSGIRYEFGPSTGQPAVAPDRAALRKAAAEYASANKVSLNIDDYLETILLISQNADKIRAQYADVKDLLAAISSIGNRDLHTFPYDGASNQELPIAIAANARFEKLMSREALSHRDSHVISFSIVSVPHEWVHLRPSVGVIYSFVASPKFAAEKQPDNTFKISETSSEYAEYSAMVALDLVMDKYFGEQTEPFIQIGVAPKSGNVGFALGFGVRAYKAFSVSAGIVYQQIDRLAGGQTVGAVVADAESVKTKSKFKSGLYIGLSAKIN